MKNKKRAAMSVVWVILGIVLFALSLMEQLDEFWSGMGSALMVVGTLQLLRLYRFNKNEDYREKMEIELSDERNRFLRLQAWAWAGYIFVIVTALSVIVLKVIGQELLSQAMGLAVCFILLLYWGSYMVLKKKY